MSDILARFANVSMGFDGRTLLTDIDLTVHKREIVTLIGPNGSGKSTLMRALIGLQAPTSGTIEKASGLRIGYMPQKLHIDSTLPLSVFHFLSLVRGVDKVQISSVLKRLSIEKLTKKQVHTLSGGETQRVLLARALLNKPNLLVLDEPVQGVDVNGQIELYNLIADIRNELQCGILMVSHDLHLVMAKTDTVVCVNQHICCSGPPQQVTQHPEYQALFGIPGAESSIAIYSHQHDHTHDDSGHISSTDNMQDEKETTHSA